jgi:hypothetical protein
MYHVRMLSRCRGSARTTPGRNGSSGQLRGSSSTFAKPNMNVSQLTALAVFSVFIRVLVGLHGYSGALTVYHRTVPFGVPSWSLTKFQLSSKA